MSPALSVIISSNSPDADLDAVFAALDQSCPQVALEIILTGGAAASVSRPPGAVKPRPTATAVDSLIPEQWGAGLRIATAPLVAFLTTDLLLTPAWWPALARLVRSEGVAGAAGGIALGSRTVSAAGVFLTRYSRFFPRDQAQSVELSDLPGEVSIYRREALLAYPDLVAGGFWEVQ